MSRINPDYNHYINTWAWIKSHNMDTKNAVILERDKFMDEIATAQYINIQAEDNKKLVNVV